MKTKCLLACSFGLLVMFTTTACKKAGVGVAPIGKWEIEATIQSGHTVTLEWHITPDNRFSGVSIVEGDTVWTFAGTWRLDNDKFTYRYTETSAPLEDDSDKTDIVLSVTDDEFICKSGKTGKVYTFHRMK